MTAFEDLSREWILAQARTGWLPLLSDLVGSHWGRGVQVDVAAIHWRGGSATQSLSMCRALRVLPGSEKDVTIAAGEQAIPVLTKGTRWSSAGL